MCTYIMLFSYRHTNITIVIYQSIVAYTAYNHMHKCYLQCTSIQINIYYLSY